MSASREAMRDLCDSIISEAPIRASRLTACSCLSLTRGDRIKQSLGAHLTRPTLAKLSLTGRTP